MQSARVLAQRVDAIPAEGSPGGGSGEAWLLAGRAPSGRITLGAGRRADRVRRALPSGHGPGELAMNRAPAARLCNSRGCAPVLNSAAMMAADPVSEVNRTDGS
jgi:hypothetical protein